jgi:hypothetical protein
MTEFMAALWEEWGDVVAWLELPDGSALVSGDGWLLRIQHSPFGEQDIVLITSRVHPDGPAFDRLRVRPNPDRAADVVAQIRRKLLTKNYLQARSEWLQKDRVVQATTDLWGRFTAWAIDNMDSFGLDDGELVHAATGQRFRLEVDDA